MYYERPDYDWDRIPDWEDEEEDLDNCPCGTYYDVYDDRHKCRPCD